MNPLDLGGLFGTVTGALSDKVVSLFGSPDTRAAQQLHAAAVAVDQARASGDTSALNNARTAFLALANDNTTRVAMQQQADAAPTLTDKVEDFLTSVRTGAVDAGIVALVVLAVIIAVTLYRARQAAA